MPIHVTPIPTLIEFATPSITIGPTAAAGDALTAIRSNSTIAGVGLITSVDNAIARFNGTGGQLQGYTSNAPTVSDTGVMLKPGNPMFTAYMASEMTNATGDGTTVTIEMDTELYASPDFNNATYTFTAPISGVYFFSVSIFISGTTATNTQTQYQIVCSDEHWYSETGYPGAGFQGSSMGSWAVHMDASDTAYVTARVVNQSGKIADIAGNDGTDRRTTFTGFLIG